jgi:hypothetical protein
VIASYLTPGTLDGTPGDGYFSADSAGIDFCSPFGVETTQTNVSESPASINYITLGSYCPTPTCPSGQFLCSEICSGYYYYECFENSDCPAGSCNRNTYCEQNEECP